MTTVTNFALEDLKTFVKPMAYEDVQMPCTRWETKEEGIDTKFT